MAKSGIWWACCMHLQASVQGYDVFARALSVGAETMVMRFDPAAPMHERYRVEHGFLHG